MSFFGCNLTHYLVSKGNIYSAKNCRSAEPKLKKNLYGVRFSAVSKWEMALWKLYGCGSSQSVDLYNGIVSCWVCFPENFPWLLPLCMNASNPVLTGPAVCSFFPVYFAVPGFPGTVDNSTFYFSLCVKSTGVIAQAAGRYHPSICFPVDFTHAALL